MDIAGTLFQGLVGHIADDGLLTDIRILVRQR